MSKAPKTSAAERTLDMFEPPKKERRARVPRKPTWYPDEGTWRYRVTAPKDLATITCIGEVYTARVGDDVERFPTMIAAATWAERKMGR